MNLCPSRLRTGACRVVDSAIYSGILMGACDVREREIGLKGEDRAADGL